MTRRACGIVVLTAMALLVYLVMPDLPAAAWGTSRTVVAGQAISSAAQYVGHDDCGQTGLASDEVTVLGRGIVKPQPSASDGDHAAVQSIARGGLRPVVRSTGTGGQGGPGGPTPTLSLLQVLRC